MPTACYSAYPYTWRYRFDFDYLFDEIVDLGGQSFLHVSMTWRWKEGPNNVPYLAKPPSNFCSTDKISPVSADESEPPI
jgi:hypothetical protein